MAGRPKSQHPSGHIGFRLPLDLLERVDRHIERLKAEARWSIPTRADAIRDLLVTALDIAEKAEEGKTKPPRKR